MPAYAKLKRLPPNDAKLAQTSFALCLKEGKHLEFTALNEQDLSNWVDGLSILIHDGKIVTIKTHEELDVLVETQLRVRLLLLARPVPAEAPPIPELPDR